MAAEFPDKLFRIFMESTAYDEDGNGQPTQIPPLDLQLTVEGHLVQSVKVTESGGTATVTTGNAATMSKPKAILGYSSQPIRWNINSDMATAGDEPISQWFFYANEDGSDLNIDAIKLTNDQAADSNNNDALVTIVCSGDYA